MPAYACVNFTCELHSPLIGNSRCDQRELPNSHTGPGVNFTVPDGPKGAS
jgi:hypothetical protein